LQKGLYIKITKSSSWHGALLFFMGHMLGEGCKMGQK
jgi:hypothetical protein